MINFSPHIKIDSVGLDNRDFATPARYEADVRRVLYQIVHTRTGSAVTQSIALAGKSLIIRPYSAADKARDPLNAFATEDDPDRSTIKDGHWTDTTGAQHLGLGGGSDAKIHFSSSTWSAFVHKHRGHTSGAFPDEILLHEMVHALRMLVGTSESVALGHLYDDEEEFFAIVIANIFASEVGRLLDIRSDHHGFRTISQNQDTSEEFLPKADMNDYRYRLVDKLVRQEPHLCVMLADIPGTFNPVRRYFELRKPATVTTTMTVPKLPKPATEYNDLPDRSGHTHRLAQGLFGRFGPGGLGFFA